MTIKLGEGIELNYQDEICTITVTNECGDCATAPLDLKNIMQMYKLTMAMVEQEERRRTPTGEAEKMQLQAMRKKLIEYCNSFEYCYDGCGCIFNVYNPCGDDLCKVAAPRQWKEMIEEE